MKTHHPVNDAELVIVESPYAPAMPKPILRCEFTQLQLLTAADLCIPRLRNCPECDSWKSWFTQLDNNVAYARAAIKDCLMRGEAPYASHLLYTQPGVLDDTIQEDRDRGMFAGFAWRQAASKTVVYTDLGVSRGMRAGIEDAKKRFAVVEYRTLK